MKFCSWIGLLLLGIVPYPLLAQHVGRPASGATARPAAVQPVIEEDPDDPPYLALAGRLGTLGPGLDLTVGIASWINARVGCNFFRLKHDGSIRDVDYDMDLKLASLPLLLDIHPFRNEFRITGGMLYNRNAADLDAAPNRDVTIGDNKYPASLIGELNGSVRFKTWAPYAGLGFGNAVLDAEKRWGFVFDLGVMMQGSPDVSLSATGPAAGHPQFQADLAKEEAEIQDDADSFKLYPVLAFGISYQF